MSRVPGDEAVVIDNNPVIEFIVTQDGHEATPSLIVIEYVKVGAVVVPQTVYIPNHVCKYVQALTPAMQLNFDVADTEYNMY